MASPMNINVRINASPAPAVERLKKVRKRSRKLNNGSAPTPESLSYLKNIIGNKTSPTGG